MILADKDANKKSSFNVNDLLRNPSQLRRPEM